MESNKQLLQNHIPSQFPQIHFVLAFVIVKVSILSMSAVLCDSCCIFSDEFVFTFQAAFDRNVNCKYTDNGQFIFSV
jgi:hypothetical protein